MNILIPGNLTLTLNHLWAMLMIVVVFKLFTSHKINRTCSGLHSYISSLLLALWQYGIAWLKEAKIKLRDLLKRMVFTDRREYLDEAESRIAE